MVRADRSQPSWDVVDLEAWLPADHRARIVWRFVEGLDLGGFYAAIGSREGEAGRPAADPAVLLALWLYATLEGVGSARALDRLVRRDLSFRWLAGGVPVNYHGLADFRVAWAEELDRLLTRSVTALVSAGVVDLQEIAVDGTKVRSPASAKSFTRGGRLERIERVAKERIEALKREVEADPAGVSRRRQAAQARAAREVEEKAAKVRAALDRLQQEKAKREKTHPKDERGKPARSVSLSDPEARRMSFADGARRAGYNVQVAALPGSGLVVGVEATDRRNDMGLAGPMVDQLARRYGAVPNRLLLDEGYVDQQDIVALADHPLGPIAIYMPPRSEKPDAELSAAGRYNRRRARSKEPPRVQEWRARMINPDSEAVFGRRKLIERVNAHFKNRGFDRITVRGRLKVHAVALWQALANNLIVAHRLMAVA